MSEDHKVEQIDVNMPVVTGLMMVSALVLYIVARG